MFTLALALSLLMGVVLGLLGGGGSILTVPILIYAAGLGTKEAIATSLLVVGLTSIVGTVTHARAGNVRWKTGVIFGLFAMAGAYPGGFAARYLNDSTLLLLFALLMGITGIAMARGRRRPGPACAGPPPKPRLRLAEVAAEGLIVGAVTGLVGAGGGFLVVPALVMFGGLAMCEAVGTSLLVIAIKSFAGLAGHLSHVDIELGIALPVAGVAIVGAVAGTLAANRVNAQKLRCSFAVFVLVMAGFTITQELWTPAAAVGGTVLLLVGWVLLLAVSVRTVRRCGLASQSL